MRRYGVTVVQPPTDMSTPFYSPMQYNTLKDEMTHYTVYAGLGGFAAGALLMYLLRRK